MVIPFSKFLMGIITAIVVMGSFVVLVARYSSETVVSAYIGIRLLLLLAIYLFALWQFLCSGLRQNARFTMLAFGAVLCVLLFPLLMSLATKPASFSIVWTQYQNMGIIFMPLGLVGMFCIRDYSWIPRLASIMVRLGVIVAIVAMAQWVIGYDLLQTIGTNVKIGDGGYGAHYGSALRSDGTPIFRPFSTLMNHYDVNAFLIMASLMCLYRFATDQCTRKRFLFEMGAMAIGILVTYNMTGWALMVAANAGASLVFVASGHFKVSLRWWIALGFAGVLSAGAIAGSEFAERIATNVNLDPASGSSAVSRFIFFYNSIQLARMNPAGWGWATAQNDLLLPITTDNYFMWVCVFGGVWYIALYIVLFVGTVAFAFASLPRLRRLDQNLFCYQTVVTFWVAAALACGLSNFFVAKGFSVVAFFWVSLGVAWSIAGEGCRRQVHG